MTSEKRYSLQDPQLKEVFKKLKKEKFKIGIHPNFNAYNNPDIIKKEKKQLEKFAGIQITEGRQHFLKWEAPKTWETYEKVGLKCDTTLGYADHEGFRCGTCYPFQPFNILKKQIIDIWEAPLIVMDGTLMGYRKMNPEQALKKMTYLLEQTQKYNGVFVFLWHNCYMTDLFSPEWKKCFEDFYKLISIKNIQYYQ
jgi:hypothetical protein